MSCRRLCPWRALLLLLALGLQLPVAPAQEAVNLARFDAQITAKNRAHWSFQPVRGPASRR